MTAKSSSLPLTLKTTPGSRESARSKWAAPLGAASIRTLHHWKKEGGRTMFRPLYSVHALGSDTLRSRAGLALLLVAVALALLTAAPSAQAQGGTCILLNARASIIIPSGGFLSGGRHDLYLNYNCTPPATSSYSIGSYGMVYGGTRKKPPRPASAATAALTTTQPRTVPMDSGTASGQAVKAAAQTAAAAVVEALAAVVAAALAALAANSGPRVRPASRRPSCR